MVRFTRQLVDDRTKMVIFEGIFKKYDVKSDNSFAIEKPSVKDC